MSNPNNCAACEHKRYPDGGHCYMFRDAPTEPCAKHAAHTAHMDRFVAEFEIVRREVAAWPKWLRDAAARAVSAPGGAESEIVINN